MLPLTEVKYQPERTRTYLGSPSVVRLPDGALVVSHDYFGIGCPRNHESEESLSSIYRSEDNGATWVNITHIMNCYWSTLFFHNDALYLLGTTQQYGSIVIRRSDDGGYTWTHPTKDNGNGWLFSGGFHHDAPNYHCAPVAVLVHEGRIYKAFEDCTPCVWGTGFQALVISAPVDADLLDAASWTMSNKIAYDPSWVPSEWGEVIEPGWREGNVVVDPDGQLWDIMSFEAGPLEAEKAARIKIEDGGKTISFDPATGYFDLPGCKAKLTIRRDPETGEYITIGNALEDMDVLRSFKDVQGPHADRYRQKHPMRQRNHAYVLASKDLWNWRRIKTLVEDETGLKPEDSVRLTGFQYIDWQFDGDDIIFAIRTAYRGAVSFHDSNRILYGTLKSFRSLL